MSQGQVCPDMSGMPIEFSNCFSAFMIMLFGTGLSFLLFLTEFLFKPKFHGVKEIDMVAEMDRAQLEYELRRARESIRKLKAQIE